jgi:hypothetical protein
VGGELDRRIARGAAARTTPTLLLLGGRERPGEEAAAWLLLERGIPGTLAVAGLAGRADALPLEAPSDLTLAMRLWLESFQEARLTL